MSSRLEARDQLECAIVGGRRGTHRTKFAEGVDVPLLARTITFWSCSSEVPGPLFT